MHPYRTHNCGELRDDHVSQTVRISGWVFRKRDHGHLLFIDLRDHYGQTQVVIYPDRAFFDACQHVRSESVIIVTGKVMARSPETINDSMSTGRIEVSADSVVVESLADPLPFQVSSEDDGSEEARLKYRFLDLRKDHLHKNIILRSRIIASLRRRMIGHGFTEFQTPILTSSSPEGARDYLVPSRVHPGKFYALPQAPQQFKQLLMVAGFDRYFQIAPCFRDEDARADRSPGEFYQLDMEMSFVTQDDVFAVVEDVIHGVFTEFSTLRIDTPPFERIPYATAMEKYGSDKPDLRIPIVMQDVSDIFKESKFNAFRTTLEKGGVVRALPVKGIADKPRSFFDRLVEHAQSLGAKGLAYLVWEGGVIKGPILKFLSEAETSALTARAGMVDGDVMFFLSDMAPVVNKVGGELRSKLGRDLDLIPKDVFRFCWIVDFPMFELDAETRSVTFSHNPFSMPQGGLQALNEKNPLDILAYQYDIVCNGVELSSGAIRNHSPEIMYKAFAIAGYPPEEVDRRFGGMINAFKLGAPPHGGIAPGVDRMVMLLAGESNIREVIAFPMNQKAQDLMMNAPNTVMEKQLRELHLKLDMPKEKNSESRIQNPE
jgi:aspartyl-tRNA synthetase